MRALSAMRTNAEFAEQFCNSSQSTLCKCAADFVRSFRPREEVFAQRADVFV
jgi:hypothetical protein